MKQKIIIIILSIFVNKLYGQDQYRAKQIVDSIYKLPAHQLYNAANLETIGRFVTSKDVAFQLFYPNGEKLDSLLGRKDDIKRSSAFVVCRIIADEDILPEINSKKQLFVKMYDPFFGAGITLSSENRNRNFEYDWENLERKIAKKYGPKYAQRAILLTKFEIYRSTGQYDQIAKTYLEYVPKFSIRISQGLENRIAWQDIFSQIDNPKLLFKVSKVYHKKLTESGQLLDRPDYIDTYANLLYKAGKIKEAIDWQRKASALNVPGRSSPEIKRNLQKMESGLPTWSN